MKKFAVVFVVSLFFVSIAYAVESTSTPATDWTVPIEAGAETLAGARYFCPMDGFTSDKPGKCENCGMDLIEMPADVVAANVATPVAE